MFCTYLCSVQQNKYTQIMETSTLATELKTAYKLNFEFEDGGSELLIECDNYNIKAQVYVRTLDSSEVGSYTSAPVCDVEGVIVVEYAVKIDDENIETELTKTELKYLSELLTEINF